MFRLLLIAIRNLSRNRRRTALALGTIIVGIAAAVFFRGFVRGYQDMFVDAHVNGQLGALQIHRKGYLATLQASPLQLNISDTPQFREQIRAVPGITAVAPRIYFGGVLSTPDDAQEQGRSVFLMLTAIDPANERMVSPRLLEWFHQGQLFESTENAEIILSEDLARSGHFRVEPTQGTVSDMSTWPALLTSDRDGAMNGEALRLTATVRLALPVDKRFGFVPLHTAQRLLRMEGRVTEYAVGVSDLRQIEHIQRALQLALGPDFEVHTWMQLAPFAQDLLRTEDAIQAIVMVILLLVVLFGILNVMLMNVLERVREIGTMMAMGVSRNQLRWLFVFEGAALGLFGGTTGLVLGGGLIVWTHQTGIALRVPGTLADAFLRPHVDFGFVVFLWLAGTAAAGLSALWATHRASRMSPVEALQT